MLSLRGDEIDRLAEIVARAVGDNLFAEIDPERHRIRRYDDSWTALAVQPWRCFECLYRNRGHVVTDDQLAAAIWPGRRPDCEQALRMVIRDVRRALAGTRWAIVTHRLIGRELVSKGMGGEPCDNT